MKGNKPKVRSGAAVVDRGTSVIKAAVNTVQPGGKK